MRILTLSHQFPPIGGSGSWLTSFLWQHCNGADTSKFMGSYELCKELVAQGHEVDVVTMAFEGLPYCELVDGIRVFRVPCLRRGDGFYKTHELGSFVLAALPKVARLAASRRYDVNHTHFIVPTGLLARLLRAWNGLPFVVTVHGSDVPGYNPHRFGLQHRVLGPLWQWILNGADQVISPSQYLRDLVQRRAPGHPVSIIPNGFRYERFRADRAKERRVLLVSRMLPREGVQYLLAALSQVDLRGFAVDIVGDGPCLATLRQMAEELRLPVRFWGWLDNRSSELRTLYERAAILACTSEAENFPTVLLEAMAAGQAIVTSNGSGCPEIVGDTALLVPPRRPDRLAEALSRLVQDDLLRAGLGERARGRVEQEFAWPNIARRHVELYRELAGRQAEPRAWGLWARPYGYVPRTASGHGSSVVGSRAPQRPR
jgi:glycosyltransferase involved in cell wall biosynthesis